jgi:hypothetical protein
VRGATDSTRGGDGDHDLTDALVDLEGILEPDEVRYVHESLTALGPGGKEERGIVRIGLKVVDPG